MDHAFRDFDLDKSGFLERHEFKAVLQKVTCIFNVEDPSESDIDAVMKELDFNGDGKISQEEFEFIKKLVIKIAREELEQHYKN